MLGEASLAQRFTEATVARGVCMIGFLFPAVPQGKARILTQIPAAHTCEDFVFAIEQFTVAQAELGNSGYNRMARRIRLG